MTWTSFWCYFFDGDDNLDTILDMTKDFLFLFITDSCCMGQYFFLLFMSGNCIGKSFWKNGACTAKLCEISSWFSLMDNALVHASGNFPADKIWERITFALSHACICLAESDDERDKKSAAANTFDIYYGNGVSSSSLSAITVSILATWDVVCCLIFTLYRFLPNDPLSSDDMVDWKMIRFW